MTTIEASASVAPVCIGIGALAKSWGPFPDKLIPTLVAVVGAVTVPLLTAWTPEAVIAGFIAGLSSTGANQLFRQIQKPE